MEFYEDFPPILSHLGRRHLYFQWSQLLNLSQKGNNNLKDGIHNLFRGPPFNATIDNFHDK